MIKRFYKQIKIQNKKISVLDFENIRKENYPINIFISRRGAHGKSYNAKDYWVEKYRKTGARAVWIFNSKSQLDANWKRFLTASLKFDKEKWQDFKLSSKGVLNKNNEIVMYFVYLARADLQKGGRDPRIEDIFYDEFNEMTYKMDDQSRNLESILHTFSDPHGDPKNLRLWIFGNQKSVAVPLLADMKIFKITEELKTYDDLILIYAPKEDLELIKKFYKENWIYEFSDLIGLSDESYGNLNLHDDTTGILEKVDFSIFKKIGYVKIESRFLCFWEFSKIIYAQWVKNPDLSQTYILRREDRDFGLPLRENFRHELIYRVQNKLILFDSVITKILICGL